MYVWLKLWLKLKLKKSSLIYLVKKLFFKLRLYIYIYIYFDDFNLNIVGLTIAIMS